MPKYSPVVPVHNEERVVRELVAHLVEVMHALDGDAEAVSVNDRSRDQTYELNLTEVALDLAERWRQGYDIRSGGRGRRDRDAWPTVEPAERKYVS